MCHINAPGQGCIPRHVSQITDLQDNGIGQYRQYGLARSMNLARCGRQHASPTGDGVANPLRSLTPEPLRGTLVEPRTRMDCWTPCPSRAQSVRKKENSPASGATSSEPCKMPLCVRELCMKIARVAAAGTSVVDGAFERGDLFVQRVSVRCIVLGAVLGAEQGTTAGTIAWIVNAVRAFRMQACGCVRV